MEATLPYFAESPLITYVPTASTHRRARGFDHAELLAKEIAKARGWPYMRLLHRKGQSRQLGADRQTRKQQLADAFKPSAQQYIKGRHIILIDDVVTTGATIEACTAMLKKAGAVRVDALLFARTMENRK
jgi:ComF family protein